jgi:hypothetical protein
MTMKRTIKIGGIVLAIGLGGCGGVGAPVPTTSDPKLVDQSIADSFDKLRGLQMVSVGGLVLNLPAEATACYGLPCPGSPYEQQYRDERARQAPRLATLANLATQANADESVQAVDPTQADAAVKALNDLAIVSVSGIVVTQPTNSVNCYTQPDVCAANEASTKQQNGLRVARALETADLAKKSGL